MNSIFCWELFVEDHRISNLESDLSARMLFRVQSSLISQISSRWWHSPARELDHLL
jgi:hypothetical protein